MKPEVQLPTGEKIPLTARFKNPESFLREFRPGGVSFPKQDPISLVTAFAWAVTERRSVVFTAGDPHPQVEKLNRVIESGRAQPLVWFSSSGSTGPPKLFGHSPASLIRSAQKVVSSIPVAPGTFFPALFPSWYMAGLLNCFLVPWLGGAKPVLFEPFNFLTPARLATSSRNFIEGSVIWLAPTMFRAMLARSTFDNVFSRIGRVLLATGPVPKSLWQSGRDRWKIPIHTSYGSTEALFVSLSRCGERWAGAGAPLDAVEVISASGSIVEKGLVIRSDTMAQMIFKSASESPVPLANPLRTKDLGHIDDDGNIHLEGRVDDVAKIGGTFFQLNRLEEEAVLVPGVNAALVVAHDFDSFQGLELLVEIDPSSNKEETLLLVRQSLQKIFSSKQVPRRITPRQIPRLANGKPDLSFRRRFGT